LAFKAAFLNVTLTVGFGRCNERVKYFTLFLFFITAWLTFPSQTQAATVENWVIKGSQNELWTQAIDEVTGYSQHYFTESFFVADPVSFIVPENFVFRFKLTPIQGVDHNFVWNFQDTENYYQAHFNGGAVWVSRFIDGEEMLSVGKNFITSLGQTYEIQLKQVGNRLTLVIDDQAIVAFDDLTHNEQSEGLVGFKLSPGAVIPVETKYEHIMAYDAAVTLLPVSLLQQNDEQWGEIEYDTASQWSDWEAPTISRWGCALTSLTMIMRYHGLTTMPDGQPVDPATVNQWLLDEEDGYVGQGLVNWFAATRLIRQISERYSVPGSQLPKLEFSYQGLPWLEVGKNELLTGRPLIAQVPGHFTVVNGYDEHNNEFLISDPLYSYQYLSQHPATLSLRLFRPSQTDLSALVAVHRPEVVVEILNESGVVVSQTWREEIVDSVSGESTEVWQFTVVNQPAAGRYQVNVVGAKEEGDVLIFTYDQLANVETYLPLKSEYINFEILSFYLAFNKETGGEIQPLDLTEPAVFSWGNFLARLNQLKNDQLINQSIYERLNALANLAAQADETTWPRYKHYLINLLEFYSTEMAGKTRNDLKEILK